MNVPLSLSLCLALLAGCARADRQPLPGDTLITDGSVPLSPVVAPIVPASAVPAMAEPGPIERRLFSAESILQHQAELGLSAAQTAELSKLSREGQASMLDLQWKLQAAKDALVAVLDTNKVDEKKAERASAELMKIETQIKSAHLTMLVRMKNLLDVEQQNKLRALSGSPCARDAAP